MMNFHFKEKSKLDQGETEEEQRVREEQEAKEAKEAEKAKKAEGSKEAEEAEEAEEVDYKALYEKEQERGEKLTEELNKSLEKEEEDPEPPKLDDIDFISSREDLEGVISEHERLNEVLQGVRQNTYEGILRVLPRIIDNMVDQKMTIRSLVSTFYQENKDLVGVRNYVQEVVTDLLPKHGNSLERVMPVLADEVRKRLEIKKPEVKKKVKAPVPPGKTKANLSTPTISNPGAEAAEESAFSKDWAEFRRGA